MSESNPTAERRSEPSARHLMAVLSNSKPDRDDEFNEWYDAHLLETIDRLHGFATGQRFEQADLPDAPAMPYRYLALYEIEGDDLDRAYEQFRYGRAERAEATAAGREPLISVSDSLDADRFLVGFFSARGAKLVSERLSGPA